MIWLLSTTLNSFVEIYTSLKYTLTVFCIVSSSCVSVSTITLLCLLWTLKLGGCSVLLISWGWLTALWWCSPQITVSGKDCVSARNQMLYIIRLCFL